MGEYKHTDIRGVLIEEGDYVAYGKSDRDYPIKLGTVQAVLEDTVEILGDGNTKVGKIPSFHTKRILVLPDDYRT